MIFCSCCNSEVHCLQLNLYSWKFSVGLLNFYLLMIRSVPHSLKLMRVGLHGANRELFLRLYFQQSLVKPSNIFDIESLSPFSCVLSVTYTSTPPMVYPYMNYQCHCRKIGSFLLMTMMIFAQFVRMVGIFFVVIHVLGPFTRVSKYLTFCIDSYSWRISRLTVHFYFLSCSIWFWSMLIWQILIYC